MQLTYNYNHDGPRDKFMCIHMYTFKNALLVSVFFSQNMVTCYWYHFSFFIFVNYYSD